MPIAQIQRDSFGRADLLRDTLARRGRKPCEWCGQENAKFIYGWCPDSIYARPVPFEGPFCSVGCYRSYTA